MINSLRSHCRFRGWKNENRSTFAEVVGNYIPGRFVTKHGVLYSYRIMCYPEIYAQQHINNSVAVQTNHPMNSTIKPRSRVSWLLPDYS